jgi:RNA polymerase sigma factor (sigma-70 family)
MIEAQTDKISDEALINLVKENHNGAIVELINRYKRMVFNLALRLLGSYHDAEEAAQDTFVKAIQAIHTFRFDCQFATWLYRICYNTCITHKRKKNLVTTNINSNVNLGNHYTPPHGLAEQSDRNKYLEMAMQTLSDEDRAIVTLFYVDETTTNEIAAIVGISEGNVRIKLHRARKKLKEELHLLLKNEEFNL